MIAQAVEIAMYKAVIAPGIHRAGKGFLLKPHLDPLVLRRSLLFYDRTIFYHPPGISFGALPEEDFLVDAGVADRVNSDETFSLNGFFRLDQNGITTDETHSRSLISAMERDLTRLGTYDSGPVHPLYVNHAHPVVSGRTHLTVELVNVIALPSRDVPLDEVISFRKAHASDFNRFWRGIDAIVDQVRERPDPVKIGQAQGELLDAIETNRRNQFKAGWAVALATGVVIGPVAALNPSLLGQFTFPAVVLGEACGVAIGCMNYCTSSAYRTVAYIQKVQNI